MWIWISWRRIWHILSVWLFFFLFLSSFFFPFLIYPCPPRASDSDLKWITNVVFVFIERTPQDRDFYASFEDEIVWILKYFFFKFEIMKDLAYLKYLWFYYSNSSECSAENSLSLAKNYTNCISVREWDPFK